MGVPIGGKTAQLLCGGGIAASRQCQIWPKKCCGAVALYGGEITTVTYKCQKLFLRRLGTNKCQSKLIGDKELNKFTSESQNQELARKLSQIVAVYLGVHYGCSCWWQNRAVVVWGWNRSKETMSDWSCC